MELLSAVVVVLFIYGVVQLIRLAISDCDLALQWAEAFGKSTKKLKGQVVWITGASSGIGEALAHRLAKDGCKLILSARREDRLKAVKDHCSEIGKTKPDDILVLPLDMLDYNSHKEAVETVLKYFKRIDILVNNAGRSQRALWEKTTFEVDRQMLDVNVLGPLSLTKAVLPYFLRQKSGHFVVTGSVAGKISSPGLGSYSGAKHALQGWYDSLRVEVYPFIKVTMVCPGPVFSEALMHAFTEDPNKKLGVASQPGEKRMTASRCAMLMAVAIANNLDEVWISQHPVLSYVYLFQYIPSIAKMLAKVAGQSRVQRIRDGVTDLH